MKGPTKQQFDFCNIWSRREALQEKTRLPLFASWWESFIASQQTLEPSNNLIEQIESVAFAYAISGNEVLGQKALSFLRELLPTYIPPASIIYKEMYPEVEADLTVANACKKLAYTYNFLHPLLESTDKQLIFSQLVEKGAGNYSSHYFTSVDPEVSTAWHNTLLVDNADQRQPPRYRMSFNLEEGGDAYCRITDMVSSYKIGMICGDATTAYGDYLDRFFRRIVYLKPNRFIIYDSIRAREVRTQRHYQWLLHSGFPIIANNDGTLEIQGKKSKLVIHPILPLPYAIKSLPTRLPKNGKERKEIHAISLRPEWHHLWNVSPKSSPYPQWDPRSHGLLYNRDLQFMVVLTVLPRREKYQYEIKPIIQKNLHGIRFTQDDETDLVYFNTAGHRFEDSNVISDAEQVVIRQKGDEILDWSIVNGQLLIYDGTPIKFPT